MRWLMWTAGVAATYYATARFGLLLQLPGTNASPVWPPSGIGLAALLLLGLRVWPGLFVGAFVANLLTLPDTTAGLVASLLIGAGNTLELVVARLLLSRVVPGSNPLDRPRDVFLLVAVAGLSCGVASTNAASALWLTGIIPAELYRPVWSTWWLGDAAGMLILTPALYSWWRAPRLGLSATRAIEFFALLTLAALLAELLYGGWWVTPIAALPSLFVVPALLWAAFRFGPRETATVAVLLSAIAVGHTWWGMRHPAGNPQAVFIPFLSPALSVNDSLRLLQVFICALVVMAIMLAAAVQERRLVRLSLSESEERFRATFDQAAVGIAHVALDGRWLRVNDKLCAIVGYSREQLLECTFQDLTHPDDLETDLAHVRQVLSGELATYSLEKRYFHKDGSIVWINLTVALVRDRAGKPRYFISVIEDIGARKRAEEQLQGERRRRDIETQQFLAMLAHELRNPMAPLLTGIEIARQSDADADVRGRALATMARSVRQMSRLVDDLLEATRVTAGTVQVRPERLDLVNLVRSTVEDRRATLERAGLTLSVDAPETPLWVMGDPTRLTQVFSNLLDNAGRFTDRGGRIAVRLALDACRKKAVAEFHDTGVGVEPALLPQLFEVFAQGDQSLDRHRGGLGLGLAVVKRLVELHQGEVEAASGGPGQGATFTVRLPVEPEPAALSSLPTEQRSGPKRLRILIIEDQRDAADSLRLLLEAVLGHEARVAYTGPDGVKQALEWQPNVVLSDLGLPGLSGLEVARQLRLHPATAKARLIALTGYGSDEDRQQTRAAGFDAHLVKPVDPEVLVSMLLAKGGADRK
jgi:PAS domain S-box-containing protein